MSSLFVLAPASRSAQPRQTWPEESNEAVSGYRAHERRDDDAEDHPRLGASIGEVIEPDPKQKQAPGQCSDERESQNRVRPHVSVCS